MDLLELNIVGLFLLSCRSSGWLGVGFLSVLAVVKTSVVTDDKRNDIFCDVFYFVLSTDREEAKSEEVRSGPKEILQKTEDTMNLCLQF